MISLLLLPLLLLLLLRLWWRRRQLLRQLRLLLPCHLLPLPCHLLLRPLGPRGGLLATVRACEEEIEDILLVYDHSGRGVLQAENSRAVDRARLQHLLRGGRCGARQRREHESARRGSRSPEERTAEEGAAAARGGPAAERRRREGALCEGQGQHPALAGRSGAHFPGNALRGGNQGRHRGKGFVRSYHRKGLIWGSREHAHVPGTQSRE